MQIKQKIKHWIKETLEIKEEIVLVHPKDIKNGDYSFFIHAGSANDFGQALSKNKIPEIAEIKVVGKFINLYLSKDFFANSVAEINKKKEEFGETNLLEDQHIIVEHTQPNPFKEFHIGHLMNNAIGESVARIIKSNGAEAVAVGYHGDIGLHVAKTIWGLRITDQVTPINQLDITMLGQAYARGSEDYDKNEYAKKQILEINKIIYSQKSDDTESQWVNGWYKKGKDISLEYFKSLYKKLDSHFNHHFYESETGEVGKDLVLKNIPAIFEKGEEGAVIFRGENFEPRTHTRVFLTKDGLPTYEAKELGLAKIKKEKFNYDKSITVTANEQDAFFDVTEVAIGEVFPKLKGKLKHLSHGMLRLPSGKMSSRTGDVITAEFLIDQVKEKVREKIADRELTNNEKEEIAEVVAIGAIKYSILRQAIGGDIIFDFEKSISFEGDSGPYLQYAVVRANSVLEKAKVSKMPFDMSRTHFDTWETTELEKYLYRFTEVVERAGQEYAPHHIVTYLTELASIFNNFYAKAKIIDQSDPSSPYKIALTQAVAHVLKSGLYLLGIKTPTKM